MKKISLLAPLLAAACGGGSSKPAAPPSTVEPSTPAAATEPAPADPHLAARKAFVSPGGMWMPRQIGEQAEALQGLGLAVDASALSDPLSPVLGAVVSLGNCSASFVSPDGLVVTNHHCVQGALAYNATPEQNLVQDGFLAKSRADEKWAGPTQRMFVAQAFRDITQDVLGGLDAIKVPAKRTEEIANRQKALIAACEKDRPGIRCKSASFFRGAEWQLTEYLEIKDVRIVYVPARDLGNFGGEVDNWAWPRHTGDWSFFRAYVGRDGQSAEFAADNVPYKPKHFLKLQPSGVKANDLVFIAGYPARTHRLDTAAETRRQAEWTLPRYVAIAKAKMDLLAELTKAGGATAIKATVAKQYIQNGFEKNGGVLEGLTQGGFSARKDAVEAHFKAWAKADPSRAKYADALTAIDAKIAEGWKTEPEDTAFKEMVGDIEGNAGKHTGSQLLRAAMAIVNNAEARALPDLKRRTGFQDRDRADNLGEIKSFTKRYDAAIDRAWFKLAIENARALKGNTPWVLTVLGRKIPRGAIGVVLAEDAVDKALDSLYAGTQLADEKVRTDLFEHATMASLKKSKDSFVKLALALLPTARAIESRGDARDGELALMWPVYMEGLLASEGGRVAPDANWTVRISYGTVKGYKPRPDAETYEPFTSVRQIPKKATGVEPFDAPKALLAAIAAGKWGPYVAPELGEVPVDSLSDLDITGGNSGSPVLNARGELIGLAFDGNIEGVASDVVFNGENTRTITVDVRYMLWVMDAVDKADHLLVEMGIEPVL